MRNIIAIAAIFACCGTAAVAVEHYLDRSILPEDRIARQMERLHDEIRTPSVTCQGVGGLITHEYILAQSIIAFERIVNYHDASQKKWVNDPVALDVLKKAMLHEADPTAQEIMKIALAGVGERSFEAELVQIIRRKDQPTIRTFTIGAICESGAISAIPDLVTLLADPYEIPAGCLRIDGEQTEFPIRQAAAFALRRFGVDVKNIGHAHFEVDSKSLNKALAKLKQLVAKPSVDDDGKPTPQP